MLAFLFNTNALFQYHFISCIYPSDHVLRVQRLGACVCQSQPGAHVPATLEETNSMGGSSGNHHLVLTAAPCKMWARYQDPDLHPGVSSGDCLCSKSAF